MKQQHDFAPLLALVSSYQSAIKEVAKVETAKSALVAESQRLARSKADIGIEDLAIGAPEHGADAIATKLKLAEEVLAARKTSALSIAGQIHLFCRKVTAECFRAASENRETLRASLRKQFLPICGGDADHARRAASHVIFHSAAQDWVDRFSNSHTASNDSVGEAETFIRIVTQFESGKAREGEIRCNHRNCSGCDDLHAN